MKLIYERKIGGPYSMLKDLSRYAASQENACFFGCIILLYHSTEDNVHSQLSKWTDEMKKW